MYYKIMTLVGDIFAVFTMDLYYGKKLGRKINKYFVLAIWVFISAFDNIIIANQNEMIVFSVYCFLMLAIVFLCYENTIKNKMISFVFLISFQSVSEFVVGVSLVFMGHPSEEKESYILGYVISKIVFLIIVRCALNISSKKNENISNIKSYASILLIPMLHIAICIMIYYSKQDEMDFSYIEVILYSIVLLVNYIAVIQYEDLQKMMRLESQNELLKNQNEHYIKQYNMSKDNWENIIKIRHNLKNEYTTQIIMLNEKKYDDLLQLYKSKISEIDSIKLISQTGNVAFDTIINYKVSEIMQFTDKFKCSVMIPDKLNIKNDDIIMILGNLLDNIEDAFKNMNSEKRGSLVIAYEKGVLYIETCNTYEGRRKTDSKGKYLTTKSDVSMHGIGLESIEKTVEKYNGKIIFESLDNIFCVRMIVEA